MAKPVAPVLTSSDENICSSGITANLLVKPTPPEV